MQDLEFDWSKKKEIEDPHTFVNIMWEPFYSIFHKNESDLGQIKQFFKIYCIEILKCDTQQT